MFLFITLYNNEAILDFFLFIMNIHNFSKEEIMCLIAYKQIQKNDFD